MQIVAHHEAEAKGGGTEPQSQFCANKSSLNTGDIVLLYQSQSWGRGRVCQ